MYVLWPTELFYKVGNIFLIKVPFNNLITYLLCYIGVGVLLLRINKCESIYFRRDLGLPVSMVWSKQTVVLLLVMFKLAHVPNGGLQVIFDIHYSLRASATGVITHALKIKCVGMNEKFVIVFLLVDRHLPVMFVYSTMD